MYLVYKPEGAEAPTRWKYEPKRMMSVEREEIERRTGKDWGDFVMSVRSNSLCRRALLFVLLRREHPGLKFADVDFSWDELEFEFSRSELLQMRAEILETKTGDEQVVMLAQIDGEIETAYDDTADPAGKDEAPPSSAA